MFTPGALGILGGEKNTDSTEDTESRRVGASRLGYRRETEMKNPDGWRLVGDGERERRNHPDPGSLIVGDADEDMVGVRKFADDLYVRILADGDDS